MSVTCPSEDGLISLLLAVTAGKPAVRYPLMWALLSYTPLCAKQAGEVASFVTQLVLYS